MFLKLICFTLTFSSIASATVFLRKDEANVILQRFRRANSGFLEEMKKGNLERECVEEICDYEEAREVFEDDDKTRTFWLTYSGRDPCLVNPCFNNGTCFYIDKSYQCICPKGFEGKYCQEVFEDTLKCLYLNGGCEHFCNATGPHRKCECADGYALGDNGKSCIAQVQYPCGKSPTPSDSTNQTVVADQQAEAMILIGANQCPKGLCPWQVLLEHKGKSLCGGALIRPKWVLTAAHCVENRDVKDLTVVAGEHNLDVVEGTEQRLAVITAATHPSFNSTTADGNLALLRLADPGALGPHAVPVCLPERLFAERELAAARFHALSGWGRRTEGGNAPRKGTLPPAPSPPVLRRLAVPLIAPTLCTLVSGVNITENLLCAGYLLGTQEACRGDDGSPLITQFSGTAFLTGVAAWGKGCTRPGYYGIYTKVANYLEWIESIMTIMKSPTSVPNHDRVKPEVPPESKKPKMV